MIFLIIKLINGKIKIQMLVGGGTLLHLALVESRDIDNEMKRKKHQFDQIKLKQERRFKRNERKKKKKRGQRRLILSLEKRIKGDQMECLPPATFLYEFHLSSHHY